MAKRISSSSVNWNLIHDAVGKKNAFAAFKALTDKHLRRVAAQPSELPKIDWNYYKSKIVTPGLVDSFKNQYESMKIPYPGDQGFLQKIDQQEGEYKQTHKTEMDKIDNQLVELKSKLAELEKVLPYSEMNMEEFYEANPELAINHDKPGLWPHHYEVPQEGSK